MQKQRRNKKHDQEVKKSNNSNNTTSELRPLPLADLLTLSHHQKYNCGQGNRRAADEDKSPEVVLSLNFIYIAPNSDLPEDCQGG